MKIDFQSLLRILLRKTGGWYLVISVLIVQTLAFSSSIVALYFVQQNAQFTSAQLSAVTKLTLLLVAIGNVLMGGWAYLTTPDARCRLSIWSQGKVLPSNTREEAAAWRQINSMPLRFVYVTFLVALLGEIVPLTFYLFRLGANSDQITYAILGGLIATIGGTALATLILDFMLWSARSVLLPKAFEVQHTWINGFPLALKFIGLAMAMVSIVVLLVGPIGYHHTILALEAKSDPALILRSMRIQSIFAGLSTLLLGLGLAYLSTKSLTTPVSHIIETFQKVEQGDLSQRANILATDEIGELAIYLNRAVERLAQLQENLESQVRERTAQLRATIEVSRAASAILDPEDLIEKVVNVISEQFGYYYVALFLVDPSGKWAELKSATGDAGRVLKENKHRLEIGGQSMVSAAITSRQPRVAQKTETEIIRFNNPLLPYTRSEIALPLIVGDRVLGALDAQSTHPSAFDPQDVETLQTMANQVAIALENARLYQEAQQNLKEMRTIQRQYLLSSWNALVDEKGNLGYTVGDEEMIGQASLEVPLTLRDQIIGEISLASEQEWTPEERNLIEAIATQAALALENARLLEESQKLAARDHLIAEVTGKIWSANTLDGILQTAIKELGRALDVSEARIELKIEENTKHED
ncbi:MAG: GAF domain-containing protein [Anaerolineae bacterium]